MRLRLLLPALLALIAVSCLAQDIETQDIVADIPWPDSERSEYVLLDQDEAEIGSGTLTVERRGGEFEFVLSFEGRGETDETVVTADAETLKPVSVRREHNNDERTVIEAEYDPENEEIRVVEIEGDEEERTVPRRLDKEHYYDNESSIFLWRTIRFEEDYEVNYYTVLPNAEQRLVSLRVLEKEEITVPAGTFDAWKLDISSEGVSQTAWYADTPARPLVQYDNTIQVFQLKSVEP
jgi:hypothetical protein